ncbi:pro-neuregulin-4, membrane-bound isoform-like [Megalops cyprinoides]|uniref:pro-neuregulin-4, membrane-bound isoform-like n=1 Tax=Megalops cyprinoides TaxID=118141 RepID=UPI001864220D|nr:pro-neuregulin-4, membrane-bound isoform-like [Megalops cyprinoides]
MAEHGDPCEVTDVAYCTNGGTCYKIPSVSTPTCVCTDNYRGSRCEEFQLFSSSKDDSQSGLIAAVVIISLLVAVVLAVVIYYACKMWKQKSQADQSSDQYRKVNSKV